MNSIAPILKEVNPPRVNVYLNVSSPTGGPEKRRLMEVMGYLELGLPDMAVESLGGTEGEMMADGDLELMRLFALEQSGASSEVLAELAWDSLQWHPPQFRMVELALIHLTAAGQFDRVMELYDEFAHTGWVIGDTLQTVVAAAANLGRFKQALKLAEESAVWHTMPSDLLMDPQLLPLWTRYAVRQVDEQEAALLRGSGLKRVLQAAVTGWVHSGVCPYTAAHMVPPRVRSWLVPGADSAFRPRYDAPAEVKRQFWQWKNDFRRSVIRLLRRAMRGAGQAASKAKNSEDFHSEAASQMDLIL